MLNNQKLHVESLCCSNNLERLFLNVLLIFKFWTPKNVSFKVWSQKRLENHILSMKVNLKSTVATGNGYMIISVYVCTGIKIRHNKNKGELTLQAGWSLKIDMWSSTLLQHSSVAEEMRNGNSSQPPHELRLFNLCF